MAGNMRSRWTDFTTDGEKNRIGTGISDEAGHARRDHGALGKRLATCPKPCSPLRIRSRPTVDPGEPHTVLEAIHRQMTHYAYHIGQIVFLAKHLKGKDWKTLSIPRGKSAHFEVARDGSLYKPK